MSLTKDKRGEINMELVKNIFFNTDRLTPNSVIKISYTGNLFQNNLLLIDSLKIVQIRQLLPSSFPNNITFAYTGQLKKLFFHSIYTFVSFSLSHKEKDRSVRN